MPVQVSTDLKPSQIVCLDHEQDSLYAEVIQIVKCRQLCWARPLILSQGPPSSPSCPHSTDPLLYDLRRSADLLWPAHLFRLALDVEVLPLLFQLEGLNSVSDNGLHPNSSNRQILNQFMQQVWRANPKAFQAS